MDADYNRELQVITGYLDRGRPQQARKTCAKLLSDYPDDSLLMVIMAESSLELGDIEEGETWIARVIEQDPELDAVRYLQFRLLTEKGLENQAEAVIIELIKDYPEDPDYYSAYSRLMLKTGHLERADKLAEEALRYAPGHLPARAVKLLVEMVYRKVDRTKIAGLVEEYPDLEFTGRMLMAHLANEGKWNDAYNVGRNLLQVNPQDEELVEDTINMRVASHPLSWILWPINKWGTPFSGLMWVGFVLFIFTMDDRNEYKRPIAVGYIFYAVYSWVLPIALRSYFRKFGF